MTSQASTPQYELGQTVIIDKKGTRGTISSQHLNLSGWRYGVKVPNSVLTFWVGESGLNTMQRAGLGQAAQEYATN